ncbi:hypothetical protein PPL_07343 [Heterostelium album PN500]|uniref:alpha-L-fucosidase n=1 Tax=Heterostelium pallidum (strain ATCC 26659 / Pp 5 / PN500) TaxID=670386 RepID=D3BF26_HETP5|nr:hypothetical protein PPL_07343 [Heterostelium album PN500]EFA80507.1 hypothetical protein PPL_07343 [Heterostelium album PN500]|eukprot:XP_020432627.1 hypothetical protein PPL_07343 [Heterostelium album PN500]
MRNLQILLFFVTIFVICNSQTYQPNWPSVNSRPLPSWYDQSKFGIFIHWGVYSVPAFATSVFPSAEWYWYSLTYPKDTDGGATQAYHNKTFGPDFTYQQFAPMFKADLFDPQQWAAIFKASGAKYVVFTSKHHEGFTNWKSEQSWSWNSVDVGPHRDLVGDLTAAVKYAGLHMGLYHSLFEWFNPTYLQDKSTGNPPTQKEYVSEVLFPQLVDIVNKYEPDLIWSDGDWEQTSAYWDSTLFLSWLYTNSSVKNTVVTNDRWGSDCRSKNGGYWTPYDRFNPGKLIGHKWENCYTIGTSWGYNENEPLQEYQSTTALLQAMVSTVSCGGNFLLDVGPTADGVIPIVMQERLIEIGEWLGVNGEAIYDSTFWRAQNDTADELIWYTTNTQTGYVYAISFVWPDSGVLELKAPVASTSATIELIGPNNNSILVSWNMNSNGQGINIKLPTLTPGQTPPFGIYTFRMMGVK